MVLITTLFFSLILTVILIPIFSKLSLRLNTGVDIPDERKVHALPIPRVGGVAIALGMVFPVVLWVPLEPVVRGFLAGSAAIVAVGLCDDIRGCSYRIKFLGQAAAAALAIIVGGIKIHTLGGLLPGEAELPQWASYFLTLVAIVGVTNAINLADGLDGLAGGISLLSFACIGYLAFMEQDYTICILAVAMGGAIFGFLRYNTFPASLFMGDTGSQLLGFGAIYLCLALTQGPTALSPLLPLIILGFPVLDTLTVMIERIAKGRSPFSPDKNHFHHRLMRLGLYHTEAVFVIYMIQAALIVGSYFLRFHSEWLLLTGYTAFSGAIIFGFHYADATGFKFERYDLVDRVIKGRLKDWRDRGVFIRIFFHGVELGVPLLLLATCFQIKTIPLQIGALAVVLLVLIIAAMIMARPKLEQAIMVSLYAMVPFLVYLGETERFEWLKGNILLAFNAGFLALAVLVVFTMKFTKRRKGFRTSPMDFLILFILLAVPFVLGLKLEGVNVGIISAKIIVFFFSLEVLTGELRGHVRRMVYWTWVLLLAVGMRALAGAVL